MKISIKTSGGIIISQESLDKARIATNCGYVLKIGPLAYLDKEKYKNFFKNYTEKVWGIDCKEIGKDWAAQRIKGLSLTSALFFALFPNSKRKPKTLFSRSRQLIRNITNKFFVYFPC